MLELTHLLRRAKTTGLLALVALCLSGGTANAQDREAWKQLQAPLSKMLNDAATRVDKVEGKDGDAARYQLTLALAKSGDYAAAQKLAARLNGTSYAVRVWATLGQMQGSEGRDRTAANESFSRAVEAAQRRKVGSDQGAAYGEIAEAQARSGDITGALRLVQALDAETRRKPLTRLALTAARRGVEAPALALLQIAGDESERSQAHSLRALAVAVSEGDVPAAREALTKVTQPVHRIPVLLQLFDHPVSGKQGDAALLDEALAAVAKNQPAPGAFGFQDVGNDAARGAIALRQLRAGTDREAAIKRAAATLGTIKEPSNAIRYIEQFCVITAPLDLDTSLAVAQPLKGEARVGALSAIARGLGKRLSTKQPEPESGLLKKVEKLVNEALATANELDEFERRWAGVPIARAVAEAGEFRAAHQVANAITRANERAQAFAAIARSAVENRREEPAREALRNLEAAALTEKQPEATAQIIAIATLALTEPLLGDESSDIASTLAGLD